MGLEGGFLEVAHRTQRLLIRKFLDFLEISREDLHDVFEMQIEILCQPFIYIVFNFSPHAPDLIIENSYNLQILCFKFRALIIGSDTVSVDQVITLVEHVNCTAIILLFHPLIH